MSQGSLILLPSDATSSLGFIRTSISYLLSLGLRFHFYSIFSVWKAAAIESMLELSYIQTLEHFSCLQKIFMSHFISHVSILSYFLSA